MSKQIITSLLDTDLYKTSMGQVAFHQFPNTDVVYSFKCRNKAVWTEEHLKEIDIQLDYFCSLIFQEDELEYLKGLNFFKKDYLLFLKKYQPQRKYINASIVDGELLIDVRGPWFLTVYFEVPVLAIVNEVYFKDEYDIPTLRSGYRLLFKKYNKLQSSKISFSDFGTRRRFSKGWQRRVVKLFSGLSNFGGTSNVWLAKELNITPIGTMAHEFIMAGAGQKNIPLVDSQAFMLQSWLNEYGWKLGIALTDTYGVDAFIRDFCIYFANVYTGVRHDSGDPIEWAYKMIEHYRSLGIEPKTKTFIFSDGLTTDKAIAIHNEIGDKCNDVYGIGTHLTNDFDGITPLQIVMKITECNGKPVAKISDTAGKGMCHDEAYLDYVKKVFQLN